MYLEVKMTGTWKEKLGGYDHKGTYRRRTSRKNTIKDKRSGLLKDFYRENKGMITIDNATELVYTGNRYISNDTKIEHSTPVYKIGVIIPKKGFEDNALKSSYVTVRAYRSGAEGRINTRWLIESTNQNLRDYFGLTFMQVYNIYTHIIAEVGIKELDWEKEVLKRNRVSVIDFNTGTRKEFLYGKPLYRYYKWSMYQESKRRKFAHRYVTGQTRASVRNWIQKGDWDAERKIPWGEVSYDWIID